MRRQLQVRENSTELAFSLCSLQGNPGAPKLAEKNDFCYVFTDVLRNYFLGFSEQQGFYQQLFVESFYLIERYCSFISIGNLIFWKCLKCNGRLKFRISKSLFSQEAGTFVRIFQWIFDQSFLTRSRR